ncbi:MAG: prepilin-type N-terminal cleavage/methylation domain-containing protein [Elusimicrobiaceae bacterium]|jgi:prepilin-type N-terminal cleavage/methylation domain-containing protein|nr:prepilin-type N-terminal cleavage/methylation domain-containing protein [Elusimicrobiaceae bacterium]MBT4008182.1 prepilin-type N-terminal cleavage/methylation domain-containing protein [Elusimicrobiaceae bacterium]MBT4402518.1 prepilin-type N-terminal cleavage/methylation domain-containing protein [Elusimicrobiaceae bacterium]MBT4439645.1 prepilin-type N-terminal cleavage/methylation domain-containing protein [Elusimicrobiaceae bacterium]MBT5988061.1 prepilin-type N-terminal cleavage/methyl
MKNKKAFTLMELLVVMIVITALMLLALPEFFNIIEDSSEQRSEVLLKKLDSAVMLYYIDHPNDAIQGGPIVDFSFTKVCPATTPDYQNLFKCGYLEEFPEEYADADEDFYVCNPYNNTLESPNCLNFHYAVMVRDGTDCFGYDDEGEYNEEACPV